MTEKHSAIPPIIRLSRLLPATPQEVFDAWLDPESVKSWMCPGAQTAPIVELDARVGGSFRVVMRDERGDFSHTGEYREIRPPERLVFTWRSNATRNEETLVTVEFSPRGDETELVLTHERLPDEPAVVGHTQGWQSIMEKFARYLGQ